jgi:hypothetical protein
MDKESELIWEQYNKTKNDQIIIEAAIDKLQGALDVVGLEPTVGTIADAGNSVISLLRAALAKEKDQKKKHMLNAGISAVSLIPGADIIKALKLRKLSKPLTKTAIGGLRAGREAAQKMKIAGNRHSVE